MHLNQHDIYSMQIISEHQIIPIHLLWNKEFIQECCIKIKEDKKNIMPLINHWSKHRRIHYPKMPLVIIKNIIQNYNVLANYSNKLYYFINFVILWYIDHYISHYCIMENHKYLSNLHFHLDDQSIIFYRTLLFFSFIKKNFFNKIFNLISFFFNKI